MAPYQAGGVGPEELSPADGAGQGHEVVQRLGLVAVLLTSVLVCAAHHRRRHEGRSSIHGGHAAGFRFLDADGNELRGPGVSTWWPTPIPAALPALPTAERMADVTAHSSEVLRDVRAALRALRFRAVEAKALLAHVLPGLHADATARQIVTAVLQAHR